MSATAEPGVHPSCLALLPPYLCTELSRLMSELTAALGPRLHAVLLYGSAARFEHHPPHSDLNLMLVLREADAEVLALVAQVVERAPRRLHLRLAVVTAAQLPALPELFPLETAELARSHLRLYGPDVSAGVEVPPDRLRAEAARRLAVTLLRLRSAFVNSTHDRRRLAERMTATLPGVMALLGAALQSRGQTPAPNHLQLAGQAAGYFGFDREPLLTLLRARHGQAGVLRGRRLVIPLFWQYTHALEVLSGRLMQEAGG